MLTEADYIALTGLTRFQAMERVKAKVDAVVTSRPTKYIGDFDFTPADFGCYVEQSITVSIAEETKNEKKQSG